MLDYIDLKSLQNHLNWSQQRLSRYLVSTPWTKSKVVPLSFIAQQFPHFYISLLAPKLNAKPIYSITELSNLLHLPRRQVLTLLRRWEIEPFHLTTYQRNNRTIRSKLFVSLQQILDRFPLDLRNSTIT